MLSSHLLALLVGFLSGFLVSIPVGPINVTIVNEGARRGFTWALLIGLGAVIMETIYCTLGFAGFGTLGLSKTFKATIELISFILMLYLGIKYLLSHSIPATSKSAEKIEEKLHPHSAFMTGFVRVLGNPGVLLYWMTIAATFASHDWVEADWQSKAMCIAGVASGAALWFVLLSYMVAKSHKKLTTNTLVRMSHVSGIFLLVVACVIGARIVMMIAKH
jgi:threonine/homoserine/homoserine lactone efflux protein